MQKIFKKYGGVIFFYTVIVAMIWVVNYRFSHLEPVELQNLAYTQIED